LPKKLSLTSQNYGFGIRDPRSGENPFRIPGPGVKKAPDPGSATLEKILHIVKYRVQYVPILRTNKIHIIKDPATQMNMDP
jgi:hypothetical protein